MNTIKTIKLGNQGLVVPTVGLGCMGMTKMMGMNTYGQAKEGESIATIHLFFGIGRQSLRHGRSLKIVNILMFF